MSAEFYGSATGPRSEVSPPITSESVALSSAAFAREKTHGPVPPVRSNTNYFFVNTVRFWCMVGIVALHATVPNGLASPHSNWLQPLFRCLVKFGTIGFFLISGFLLGKRFDDCRPMDYLGRRIKKVLLPWLFWVGALVAHGMWHASRMGSASGHRLGQLIYEAVFFTTYWFVPNLMVGLCILLLFRKRIYDLRLGGALLLVNAVYVVNIYTQWFTPIHTTALFGFVFYLWLGAFTARHYARFESWLAARSMWIFSLAVPITFCMAMLEVHVLQARHSPEPVNTLAMGIQAYSIAAALLLMKMQRRTWPHWLDVRQHTFGIYLIHPLFLIVGNRMVAVWLSSQPQGMHPLSDAAWLTFWLTQFAVIYLLSAFTARLLANTPALSWVISASPQRQPPAPSIASGIEMQWDRV